MKKTIILGITVIMTMAFVGVASAQLEPDADGVMHYVPPKESAVLQTGEEPSTIWATDNN